MLNEIVEALCNVFRSISFSLLLLGPKFLLYFAVCICMSVCMPVVCR